MTRQSQKLVERATGSGKIFTDDGKFISNCRYALNVHQVMHELPGETVPGLRDIKGYISEAMNLFNFFGSLLTLELEDRRRINFFAASIEVNGQSAEIQGSGDFANSD